LRRWRFSGVKRAGGWSGIAAALPDVMTHTWKYIGERQSEPDGRGSVRLVAGLGFVLSFGYWCTDFLVVQRAMAAENDVGARRTPLLAAFPKMIMPFIVIVPGIAALALTQWRGYSLPLKGGGYDYDQALTTLMAQFYPSGMLGVGLTALMASFMSGMAGNVTAFNTVFTYDIYQGYIRPTPRRITCGWAASPPSWASRCRSPRPTWRRTSTTSWIFCSWSSAS
jgi:SSS family solute:Na+ symporter